MHYYSYYSLFSINLESQMNESVEGIAL